MAQSKEKPPAPRVGASSSSSTFTRPSISSWCSGAHRASRGSKTKSAHQGRGGGGLQHGTSKRKPWSFWGLKVLPLLLSAQPKGYDVFEAQETEPCVGNHGVGVKEQIPHEDFRDQGRLDPFDSAPEFGPLAHCVGYAPEFSGRNTSKLEALRWT